MARKKDTLSNLVGRIKGGLEATESPAEATASDGQNWAQRLTILPELKELIPPLKKEEFEELRLSIRSEGCRDPLVVWQTQEDAYILVDGHNRFAICREEGVPFQVRVRAFDSLEEVQAWMYQNQLGRRNLTSEQTAYLRGKQYELEKARWGGDRTEGASDQNDRLPQSTDQRLAEEHKVGAATIRRDAQFARGIDLVGTVNPELKARILAGDTPLRKSDIQKLAQLYTDQSLPPVDDIQALRRLLREDRTNLQATDPDPPDWSQLTQLLHRKSVILLEEPDGVRARYLLSDIKNILRQLESLAPRSS